MPDETSLVVPDGRRRFFYGPNGLRAGWRLLIFEILFAALLSARGFIAARTMHGLDQGSMFVFRSGTRFLLCLLAAWIMGRFERRTIADYGLPWRKMFRGQFWLGTLMGFASLTALLGIMSALGVFHFGALALHGAGIWRWGAIYGVVFLLVGFSEEFVYRGYAQFTLASGIGFWPAAIVWNSLFALSHFNNTGETWIGLVNAGLAGLFFCLLLQRSGNLWMAIGLHAAWDWAQTYFYGVPDSGIVVPGHLLQSASSGSRWLSGGTVGPEGSLLCTATFAAIFLAIWFWMPGTHHPETAAAVPSESAA